MVYECATRGTPALWIVSRAKTANVLPGQPRYMIASFLPTQTKGDSEACLPKLVYTFNLVSLHREIVYPYLLGSYFCYLPIYVFLLFNLIVHALSLETICTE